MNNKSDRCNTNYPETDQVFTKNSFFFRIESDERGKNFVKTDLVETDSWQRV